MKKYFLLTLLSCVLFKLLAFEGNETYTYAELIKHYQDLDESFPEAKLLEVGPSDAGKPIHLFLIDKTQSFDPEQIAAGNKIVVLINNGIHAGEPCGIDASVRLAEQLLDENHLMHAYLDSVVVLIVPTYNIGGILNRGSFSRVNQNGPEEYGFRGNARNLDLNRDFVKCDSRNAATFSRLFTRWKPDFFIDTHTTNGSDHQYTMTLISTQKDKSNPVLSSYQEGKILPNLFEQMKYEGKEMIPYVNVHGKSPEEGFAGFLETARYSSGYAALHDCFSFITEAHMLKPFEERVEHTLAFLKNLLVYAAVNRTEIKATINEARDYTLQLESFPLAWELDTTSPFIDLPFKGYETVHRKSELSGQTMLFYDTSRTYFKKVPYYNDYRVTLQRKKPRYYVVPQAFREVVERLQWNHIQMEELAEDTMLEVSSYYITDFTTSNQAFEGHYLHDEVTVASREIELLFLKGDYLVSSDQPGIRYLMTVLEPESMDAFFVWNFFDEILQQKEWFSPYVFEPKALALLAEDPVLKAEFEAKKQADPAFAEDSFQQLYFIYQRSPYFEPAYRRYPVYRID
jgi:hypothetical protein